MSNGASQPPRERPAAPAARPARPAAPASRPAGPTSAGSPAERTVIPQGLSLADPGLSGIPALRPVFDAAEVRRELHRAKVHRLRQTLLPSCLVLGTTLPLLAAGWFTLDRFSVVRDNALGVALPVMLAIAGLFFLVATALLAGASARRPPAAD